MSARRWGLGILTSVASVAILAGRLPAQAPAGADVTKPAAIVDGTPISWAELEAVVKQAPPSPTPLTEAQKKQMRMEALSMLIDDVLMQHFLRKSGPHVDPNEITKKLADMEESLKRQKKTFQDFLKESGQSEAQLRINILNMLQWTAFVKQHLTDADVRKYYDESKEFFDRVAVRASHIVIRLSANSPSTERESTRGKLAALRNEIVSGRIDFADAAKKYSHCASAPNGGDVGYFPRKLAMEEPFAKAAFALKVGEVSDVVETDYGLHLIKVTDRKPGQPSDFEKIKDDVREMCTEEMRMGLLAQQRKTSHVEINLPKE